MNTGSDRVPAVPALPAEAPIVEVVVGKVGKAHGLRGDVVVDVRTDEPARRFAGGTRFETPLGHLTVSSTHWHGTRLLVHFAEVSDREAAEAQRGVELRLDVSADERPEDPEEFYDHQLLRLSVVDADGAPAGYVEEVLHLPAQDVLVIRRADGSDSLVPFVRALVSAVDLADRRLLLAPGAAEPSEGGETPAPPSAPPPAEPGQQ